MDLDSFRREFWPDQPFVAHGPLDRLPALFLDPRLRDLHALSADYRGRVLFGRGRMGPRSILVHDVEAAPLYQMGLSLYLPDLEAVLPDAGPWLRTLERELGIGDGRARMTAFASPAADGIACHFDAEDVFSIQLAGAKRFWVAETPAVLHPVGAQYGPGIPPAPDLYPQVADGFPDPGEAEFTEIVMQPGSVLFLPRGFWHRTEADADSLSISVILSPPAVVDVLLNRLRDLLLQDPAWRRPAHGAGLSGEHPGGIDGFAAERLAALPAILAAITPADLWERGADERQRWEPDTLFQIVPGSPPAGAADAADDPAFLDWALATRAAFTLSEARVRSALGQERLEEQLQRLIADGVLRRLPYRRLPSR